MPKISILMGIYNCADTLSEAIDSILNQTYTNWELILCDDASKDNTYMIAQKYQLQYPDKIVLLKNEKNMRLASTLNHCAQYAKGEYLARMDGDDISSPRRFEKQAEFLDEHQEFAIVGTYMQAFDENGIKNIVPVKIEPSKYDLPKMTPFNHATIFIRKKVFNELQGYRVSQLTSRAEDVDLWFRFFAAGYKGYNLIEPLYYVREDTATFKRRSWKASIEASQVLWHGIKILNLPFYYRIFSMKPILSQMTPRFIKRVFRKSIDKGNRE